ncbi:hypothetical protein [Phenylobacterium sp.]|uniref:hypothetical protein n=1 Tax=Phenylobacterium sp. TaxID=1871053 RepID=UPI0012201564|nr:hypothetical protein [Phenylobacterium sp.]THD60317.1 MAG: hypothetical protein E8A12_10660 [Phenylobacterium sp.]
MTAQTEAAARGLLLPPGVVQPFLLLHRHDDLHIMGFIEGHPKYEAVEAMIQRRAASAWSIRAILTRHDQTQIDHVNDPHLLTRMKGAKREIVQRPIELTLEDTGHARRARLAFVSGDGEPVILDLETIGPPSPERGGLTDPAGHSPDSSLPLMLRRASTLAAPTSRVIVDGVEYRLPEKLSTPAFVAQEGFYTEGHDMGVLRAGEVALRRLSSPERAEVGARWAFETPDGDRLDYVIDARTPDGELILSKDDGSGETLTAYPAGDQLDLTRVYVPSEPLGAGGLTLSLGPGGRFGLSMDRAADLVTGQAATTPSAGGAIMALRPVEPAWAAARPVTVTCTQKGDRLRFVTTIGPG